MQVGIAGELRCVVSDADGTIKIDTGFQKNLILNQGLDFFGGAHGSYFNHHCVIGTGNSVPEITQTKLDIAVAFATGVDTTSDYAYVDKGDNLYRMWEQKKYRYTGLNDINISEVGLASAGSTISNYYLTTRALIKDKSGMPTSISVKTGETLDIYYKIHKVIDTSDQKFVVNMLDGDGGTVEPYNVTIRPIRVGSASFNTVSGFLRVITHGTNLYQKFFLSESDLSSITGEPSLKSESLDSKFLVLQPYDAGTYKRVMNVQLGLNEGNAKPIRTVSLTTGFADWVPVVFLPFQVRYGSVADDSPITKSIKHTLTLPLEFSWGRYEGDL